mgnify:CR=1 FL=1
MNSNARDKTVGLVGLGAMGMPMALNILKAGHPLIAFDIDARKNDQLAARGASIGKGPADVKRRAKIVISMVDTTAQAEEVIMGPGGFIEATQPGDLIISMSTIDPAVLRAMGKALGAKQVDLIDSPVAGQEKGAIAGTLKAFVGGTPAALEKARPVLDSMTSEILHFGALGQGTTMKLINNMLIQITWVLVAEGLILGTKAGLDPKQMVETIMKATGNSVAFEYSAPRILARNFEGTRLDITFKDIELQLAMARSLKVPLFAASVGQQVFQMARAMGLGSEDGGAALIKVYEQLTGITVSAS